MKQRVLIQLTILVAVGFLTFLLGLTPKVYADNPTGENVEIVSQLWGGFDALFVEGNTAYMSDGSRLVILDFTNPVTPIVIGKSAVAPGFIQGIFVTNNKAYVADAYPGLRIFDVSVPANPTELGRLSLPTGATGIFVVGNIAYVAAGSSGLRIIDVSSPAAPTELGVYDTPTINKIYVSGTTAYVAAGSSGLRIIDVSNPVLPTELGFYQGPIGESALEVVVVSTTAYVAYSDGGLRVVDISNPTNPTELGFLLSPNQAKGVYAADNNTAYVADENDGLQIIDVTNPLSPTLIGAEDEAEGEGVYVVGDKAYVANRGGTLRVVDISNPAAPAQVGIYTGLYDLDPPYVADGRAYVGYSDGQGGMRILDVSDPTAPNLLGDFTTFHIGNIVVSGTLAHITNGNFHTFDVSDPVNPTMLSFLSGAPSGAEGLAVVGNIAYVANGSVGLRILDVSTPINPSPTVLGTYDTPGLANDVFVAGSRAYVADDDQGLRIIDVSNPASPVELGFYDTPGEAGTVHVAGNIAYVTEWGAGLFLIDVSNLGNPTLVGLYHTEQATDVYVAGNIAYLTDESEGVYVLDVSDPATPTQVGYFSLDNAGGVYVVDDLAYVTTEWAGLHILRFTGVPPVFTATGQVTDSSSDPVTGVTVSTNKGQQTATNSSGVFTLTNLAAGDYTLTPYKVGYTFSPITRSVTISPSVSGQDFTAAPIVDSGNIQGQVAATGGASLAGITVLAYQNQGGTWHGVDSTMTDSSGTYAFSLPVGVYRLYFADSAQNYINEYYNNQTTLNGGVDVTVTANQTTANINAELAATPAPLIAVSGDVSTALNRQTGQVTIRGSASATSQATITRTITCASGNPANVTLLVGSNAFAMAAGSNNQYSVTLTLPDDVPDTGGVANLSIQYRCDTSVSLQVGSIALYDPSGQVTDKNGQPIAGATVNLYRVLGALPDKDGQTNDCRTVSTRPGGSGGDWSGVPSATIDTGVWVNPDLATINGTAEISPPINPQITGSDGRYAWDTAEGCWYIVVAAKGYHIQISPLVGIPPEVTDLDMVLTEGKVYLPVILK